MITSEPDKPEPDNVNDLDVLNPFTQMVSYAGSAETETVNVLETTVTLKLVADEFPQLFPAFTLIFPDALLQFTLIEDVF